MKGEAFVNFKEEMAIAAIFPFYQRTVLGITQIAEISTLMIGSFVKSFPALMVELLASKESRHACEHVIVIIVVVQVEVFTGKEPI